MNFLPDTLTSFGMASYHTFPFAQFISPLAPNSMIERGLDFTEDVNSSSSPYKKLKTQSPNGVLSSRTPGQENAEIENRDNQGFICHLQNEPVNLITRNENPRQNTQSNDFYPGHVSVESQTFPMTFVSGFLTTSIMPAQPSDSTNISSPFEQFNLQHAALQNQQFPMVSLSDLSAMKKDWFRMKYAESQDPMWAYLLEQQEDFLKFTNKITEIINICSGQTEVRANSEEFGRNRNSSRNPRNARNNEEDQEPTQKSKRKTNKQSKPAKKQLRNKRSS